MSVNRVLIYFANNNPGHLMANFLSHPEASGNAVLDKLYNEYGFTEIINMNSDYLILLKSEKKYNITAISRSLAEINGIESVLPGSDFKIGGNGRISSYKNGDVDVFKFTYGWPHSSSGYLVYHSWEIGVYSDCNVTYIGSSGYDLPG